MRALGREVEDLAIACLPGSSLRARLRVVGDAPQPVRHRASDAAP
jgi:hypothetical protein